MSKNPRDILKAARPQEKTVTLSLRPDLAAEHAAAEAELQALTVTELLPDLDATRATALAERIEALQDEMAAEMLTLRFRALPRDVYDGLLLEHPPREGFHELFNLGTFTYALARGCLVEPDFDDTEFAELFDVMNEGQRDQVLNAAWDANQEVTSVPFSERASVVTRWRERTSKQPEPGASPSPSS